MNEINLYSLYFTDGQSTIEKQVLVPVGCIPMALPPPPYYKFLRMEKHINPPLANIPTIKITEENYAARITHQA